MKFRVLVELYTVNPPSYEFGGSNPPLPTNCYGTHNQEKNELALFWIFTQAHTSFVNDCLFKSFLELKVILGAMANGVKRYIPKRQWVFK